MESFAALKWEGQYLSKVKRGDVWRNAIHGLYGGYIVGEKTTYLYECSLPAMVIPKINPDDPGYDGSDKSSLYE